MKVGSKIILETPKYTEDDFIFSMEQDDFLVCLGSYIRAFITDSMCVKVTFKNVGWQHREGEFAVRLSAGTDKYLAEVMLSKILPNTSDYKMKVNRLVPKSRGLFITVTHHDNPVGGDRFFLTPCAERTFNRLR